MSQRILFVLGLVVLALVGCANPADNKPEAEVGAPVPEPAAQAEHDHPGHSKKFTLAEGSSIGFTGSKVTGSHDGGFNAFTGMIDLIHDNPTQSSVEVSIDTTSLWSDSDRLTGHLKSADFFDVEKFPTSTFKSTSIAAADQGYTITGNLDLHGVTKSISFPATISVEGDRVTAQAEFFIQRFDFGIEYKGKADDLIRDEVVIKLDLVAQATGS